MNQYDWYQRALKGEKGLPLTERPEAGFYRRKNRNGFDPVAYWYEDGKLLCKSGNRMVPELQALEMWPFISADPIEHDVYEAVAERGEPWPDLHSSVTEMNNNPPDDHSFEALRDAIEDLAREARLLAEGGAAPNQAKADQASDLANKLGELEKRSDESRKREKQPHADAAKAVDDAWNPIRDAAAAAKALVKAKVITPFLRAKDEAERKAREQAEKAGDPLPEVPRGVSTTKAGSRGRPVALKTVRKAKIVDRKKVLEHFCQHPKIDEVLQSLADQSVKLQMAVPGVEIVEEKVGV